MANPMIQLIVLAVIAVFLILRLRKVLGTREGFEPIPAPAPDRKFDVIDGTAEQIDDDLADHVDLENPAYAQLEQMKRAEPSFHLGEFLNGAKSAYEMIIMAFERGDIDDIRPFVSPEISAAFDQVIADRKAKGHEVTATYLGTREVTLAGASFDPDTAEGEVTVRFVGEMITVTRDAQGHVVEGDAKAARKQRDTWTFARKMGQDDPNWQLVATGV